MGADIMMRTKKKMPKLLQLSKHQNPKLRAFVEDVIRAQNLGLLKEQIIAMNDKRIIGRLMITKENGYELVELATHLEKNHGMRTKYLKFPQVVGCCGLEYVFKLE